jgi:hypothetical protein
MAATHRAAYRTSQLIRGRSQAARAETGNHFRFDLTITEPGPSTPDEARRAAIIRPSPLMLRRETGSGPRRPPPLLPLRLGVVGDPGAAREGKMGHFLGASCLRFAYDGQCLGGAGRIDDEM